MEPPDRLTFSWWNLHNFAHYDAGRSGLPRWPKDLAHYEAKRDRILEALANLSAPSFPDLITVCEITREAAQDLATRLPADFEIETSPIIPHEDDFQVAIFYRKDIGLTPQFPLIPSDREEVSRDTRPMLAVHLTIPGHIIRFVACHWTSMDEESSQLARTRLADYLRRDTYDFFNPGAAKHAATRHVIILGDLNEEPTNSLFRNNLIGKRDRRSSRAKQHWMDGNYKRIRLYNLAWRYLGEQFPHGIDHPPIGETAGTHYDGAKGWRTLDHILASGSLLGNKPPFLDEEKTRIVNHPMMRVKNGLPGPFVPGKTVGISDHLPIVGQLILPGNVK